MGRGSGRLCARSTAHARRYAAPVATVLERIGAGRFVSFELWPPRSAESASALEAALDELAGVGPGVVAVTFRARGPAPGGPPQLLLRPLGPPLFPPSPLPGPAPCPA